MKQLVDAGETQRLLRLDRHHPNELQVRGTLHDVAEQRGLPHTRLTPKNQRAAHTGTHTDEHLVEGPLYSGRATAPRRR